MPLDQLGIWFKICKNRKTRGLNRPIDGFSGQNAEVNDCPAAIAREISRVQHKDLHCSQDYTGSSLSGRLPSIRPFFPPWWSGLRLAGSWGWWEWWTKRHAKWIEVRVSLVWEWWEMPHGENSMMHSMILRPTNWWEFTHQRTSCFGIRRYWE